MICKFRFVGVVLLKTLKFVPNTFAKKKKQNEKYFNLASSFLRISAEGVPTYVSPTYAVQIYGQNFIGSFQSVI